MAKVEICEEGKEENQQKFLHRYEELCTQSRRATHSPEPPWPMTAGALGRSHRFR